MPGSLFLVVAVPSLSMTTLRSSYELVPAIVLTAVAVELLGRRLPTAVLTGVATGLLTTGWVLSLAATAELRWSLELLTGSIGSATAAGYLVGGWCRAPAAPTGPCPWGDRSCPTADTARAPQAYGGDRSRPRTP